MDAYGRGAGEQRTYIGRGHKTAMSRCFCNEPALCCRTRSLSLFLSPFLFSPLSLPCCRPIKIDIKHARARPRRPRRRPRPVSPALSRRCKLELLMKWADNCKNDVNSPCDYDDCNCESEDGWTDADESARMRVSARDRDTDSLARPPPMHKTAGFRSRWSEWELRRKGPTTVRSSTLITQSFLPAKL